MLQLYSFDSGYSLVVLEEVGRRHKRGSDITNFFPNIAFYFYYHQMNLLYSFIISKILVYIYLILFFYKPLKFNRKRLSHKLCYISGIFDNILRWKFFLERDISMIFCGHRHILITHCLTLAYAGIRYKNMNSDATNPTNIGHELRCHEPH